MKYIMWRFWVTTAGVEVSARRWYASTPKHDELKSVFVEIEDEVVSVQHMQETPMMCIMWRFWVTMAGDEESARRWSASTVLPAATFLY